MTPSTLSDPWVVFPGGIKLYRHDWNTTHSPRAVVLIVHGYAEHGGRYERLALDLCAAGCRVASYDHRGHGRSSGRRAFMGSHDVFVNDLIRIARIVRQDAPGLPLVLFGHSMGGALCILAALEDAELTDGLILSSPALDSDYAPILKKFAPLLGRLLPTFPTVHLDRDQLSHDEDYVADAKEDQLNYHGRMPARTGSELLRVMSRIEENGHALELPILLIHGTADKICDPEASYDYYNRLKSRDKTLALFDDLFHETFNEPKRGRVIDDIKEWLEEHFSEPVEDPREVADR